MKATLAIVEQIDDEHGHTRTKVTTMGTVVACPACGELVENAEHTCDTVKGRVVTQVTQ